MGHELEMHPLLAILTLTVGGAVGGIIGIYLSVPICRRAPCRLPQLRFTDKRPSDA
jgi:hypothetical protein